MDNNKLASTVLLCLVLGLIVYLLGALPGGAPAFVKVFHTATKPVIDCKPLFDKCEVDVQIDVPDCSESNATNQLERMLSNPLELSNCRQAVTRLQNGCLEGCRADFSTLALVQGNVDMRFQEPPADQTRASCRASAKRPVTMKLLCVQDAA